MNAERDGFDKVTRDCLSACGFKRVPDDRAEMWRKRYNRRRHTVYAARDVGGAVYFRCLVVRDGAWNGRDYAIGTARVLLAWAGMPDGP